MAEVRRPRASSTDSTDTLAASESDDDELRREESYPSNQAAHPALANSPEKCDAKWSYLVTPVQGGAGSVRVSVEAEENDGGSVGDAGEAEENDGGSVGDAGETEELDGRAVDDDAGEADDEAGQTTHEALEDTCYTLDEGAAECARMHAERDEEHQAQLEEQLEASLAHSQTGNLREIAHEEDGTDYSDYEGEVCVVDQADENAPPATGGKARAKPATTKRNAQRKNASAKNTNRDAGYVSSQLVDERRVGRFMPRATSGECAFTCIPDAFSWILSLLVLNGYDVTRFSVSSELRTIRDLMNEDVSARGYPTFARMREVAAMYGLDLLGPLRIFDMKPYVLFQRILGKRYLLCLTLFKGKGTPPDDHTVGYDDSLAHPTDPAALGCLVCNIPYTTPTYLYPADRASPERAIAALRGLYPRKRFPAVTKVVLKWVYEVAPLQAAEPPAASGGACVGSEVRSTALPAGMPSPTSSPVKKKKRP